VCWGVEQEVWHVQSCSCTSAPWVRIPSRRGRRTASCEQRISSVLEEHANHRRWWDSRLSVAIRRIADVVERVSDGRWTECLRCSSRIGPAAAGRTFLHLGREHPCAKQGHGNQYYDYQKRLVQFMHRDSPAYTGGSGNRVPIYARGQGSAATTASQYYNQPPGVKTYLSGLGGAILTAQPSHPSTVWQDCAMYSYSWEASGDVNVLFPMRVDTLDVA
jgi:hypothetical protein